MTTPSFYTREIESDRATLLYREMLLERGILLNMTVAEWVVLLRKQAHSKMFGLFDRSKVTTLLGSDAIPSRAVGLLRVVRQTSLPGHNYMPGMRPVGLLDELWLTPQVRGDVAATNALYLTARDFFAAGNCVQVYTLAQDARAAVALEHMGFSKFGVYVAACADVQWTEPE